MSETLDGTHDIGGEDGPLVRTVLSVRYPNRQRRWYSRACAVLALLLAVAGLALTPGYLLARQRDPVDTAQDEVSAQTVDTTAVVNANATLSVAESLYGDLGLRQAMHAAVSPDDKHVYVAAQESNAIVVLARDVVSGTLPFVAAYRDNQDGIDGLGGAVFAAVTQDGNNVYVAGRTDDSIAVFRRDASTGRLTFVEHLEDGIYGVDGLDGANYVAISNSGEHVYVTAEGKDQGVSLFRRNPADGALTYVRTYRNGDDGVTGLDGARTVVLSPDGAHVYVANIEENAIVTFARNKTNGELTFVETVGEADDESGGVEGLAGPRSLAVSSDGQHVYVAAENAGAIVVFARDATTGRLSPVETLFGSQLFAVADLAVSTDGAFLYAVAFGAQALSTYTRTASSGELQLAQVLTATTATGVIPGLKSPTSVAISSDDQHVLVTGFNDFTTPSGAALISGAVSLFERSATDGILVPSDSRTNRSGPDTNPLFGLQAGLAATVSPDGKQVYVGGLADDAITVFDRNASDGAAGLVQTVVNDSSSGLIGLQALALSPDGKHLYAPGLFSNSVAVFARSPMTGGLTFVEQVQNGQDGVTGLNGAYRVAVSVDGKHVYALGFTDGSVVVFRRDATSGKLTFVEAVETSPSSGPKIVGFPSAIAIHPDGRAVYVTVQNTNSLLVYAREPSSGGLRRIQELTDGRDGMRGLLDATTVAVPVDGAHVYAAGPDSDSIAVFAVNDGDGKLEFRHEIAAEEPTVVQASPDGTSVYVVSKQESKVALFGRNLQSGLLILADEQVDGEKGVSGLDNPTALAISPDSRFVYVPGGLGNSLIVFAQSGDLPTSLKTYLPAILR